MNAYQNGEVVGMILGYILLFLIVVGLVWLGWKMWRWAKLRPSKPTQIIDWKSSRDLQEDAEVQSYRLPSEMSGE